MADTRVQLQAEDWIRRTWLLQQYGQSFTRRRLTLNAGGDFEFDAVSADNSIVADISTSGGKAGAGKLHKLRADMLFLIMADAQRRIVVLTEHDMYEVCQEEKRNGRVPLDIEFVHAELPEDLASQLKEARGIASDEMSPSWRK